MRKGMAFNVRRAKDVVYQYCDGEVLGAEFGIYPGMIPTDEPEDMKQVSDEHASKLFMILYFAPAPSLA